MPSVLLWNDLMKRWHTHAIKNIQQGTISPRHCVGCCIKSWGRHTSSSWITTLSWRRGLPNSMQLWATPCRVTQDRQVIVKSSDKTWFAGERNGKPLHYSYHTNLMNSMKRQKDMTLQNESPRSEGVQYATGVKWRAIMNSSRKNEVTGPKQKQCSVVDVWWCCKKQYCIGIWNVRSMRQGKFRYKQEMARVNTDILVHQSGK